MLFALKYTTIEPDLFISGGTMNYQTVLVIVSVSIGLYGFIPYFRSVLKLQTKPHVFTWLIWFITQGTGVIGMWVGGAGLGAIPLTIGLVLVFTIFCLSLKYGTTDITRSDVCALIVALIAIGIWVFLHNPLIAILLVSAIDIVGFIPTFRKSYNDPMSEPTLPWALFATANACSILALDTYNVLTVTYVATICFCDFVLASFLFIEKKRMRLKGENNEQLQ